MTQKVVPLIMSGGAGTRLWPASRESAPKQFINLLGELSSFQETVERVTDASLFSDPVIITNRQYAHIVADQLDSIGVQASILLEPFRRDSGPAIAAGASFILERDPGAVILVLPSDHVVRDEEAFRNAVRAALKAAISGKIVTFGIKPDHPATGYGYIRPGEIADDVAAVEAFVEKPDEETAARYVAEGYLWNSGNFMFRADLLLSEYGRLDPQTVDAARTAVRNATTDLGWTVLDPALSRAAPPCRSISP